LIEQGLESDVLMLAGGVSAGLADLVPATLTECGVREIFHGVAIKPGKPIWFGVREISGRRQYVFGLPGNPVSTMVCFEVFVKGCCQMLGGAPGGERETLRGRMACEHRVRGPRPTYWPVSLAIDDHGQQIVTPLPWQGSSDLKCLAAANGLAILPPRDNPYMPGDIVSVLPLNCW
jgi:molybdopterin molybdotransferase